MKNSNTAMYTMISVLMLLIGGMIGGFGFSEETIKTIKVPGNTIYKNNTEIVYKNITEVKEVEKDWLTIAVNEFWNSVEDEEDEAGNKLDLLECGEASYDFDEMEISRIKDRWAITIDEEDRLVDFEVRLKYKEEDEKSCRATYKVWVLYEDDEDTIVKAELQ